jgi:hypothetical protein
VQENSFAKYVTRDTILPSWRYSKDLCCPQGHYEQYEDVQWDQKPGAPPVVYFFNSLGEKFETVEIEKEWSTDRLHEILQGHGFVRYVSERAGLWSLRQSSKYRPRTHRNAVPKPEEGEREDL